MERREKSCEIPAHRSRQRERFNDTDNFLKAKVLKFTQDVENLSHAIIKKEMKKNVSYLKIQAPKPWSL